MLLGIRNRRTEKVFEKRKTYKWLGRLGFQIFVKALWDAHKIERNIYRNKGIGKENLKTVRTVKNITELGNTINNVKTGNIFN